MFLMKPNDLSVKVDSKSHSQNIFTIEIRTEVSNVIRFGKEGSISRAVHILLLSSVA